MIIHRIEHEALTTIKQASHLAIQTLFMDMAGEIFPEYLSAGLRVIGTLDKCVIAKIKMSLQVTPLDFLCLTVLVWTLDREFQDEPTDWNVRLELSDDSHIAKRATSSVLDTLVTEQVVAAWSFYSVLEHIKADRTDPSVICQTLCREVRESLRSFELFDA